MSKNLPAAKRVEKPRPCAKGARKKLRNGSEIKKRGDVDSGERGGARRMRDFFRDFSTRKRTQNLYVKIRASVGSDSGRFSGHFSCTPFFCWGGRWGCALFRVPFCAFFRVPFCVFFRVPHPLLAPHNDIKAATKPENARKQKKNGKLDPKIHAGSVLPEGQAKTLGSSASAQASADPATTSTSSAELNFFSLAAAHAESDTSLGSLDAALCMVEVFSSDPDFSPSSSPPEDFDSDDSASYCCDSSLTSATASFTPSAPCSADCLLRPCTTFCITSTAHLVHPTFELLRHLHKRRFRQMRRRSSGRQRRC